jgi:hypothetical protein
MKKEDIQTLLIIYTKNVIFAICFTILAIYFKQWWISLFTALFYTIYTTEKKCDDKEGD